MLSVVVNVHREGLWAYKSMRSAVAALQHFRRVHGHDASCEIVVVADRPDPATLDAINAVDHGTSIPVQVLVVNYADLGQSRNHGVRAAKGKYVAFLDGDDIWGTAWPLAGVAQLERLEAEHANYKGRFVAHPCLNIDFGDGAFWWAQPDQRQADFHPGLFWNTNCWSSGVMAPRELLILLPYKTRTKGLGFEDWEWNARTLADGVVHTSVAEAVVFIRKKSDGLNVQSAMQHQLIAHSTYFESDPAALPTHDKLGKVEQPKVSPAVLSDEWKRAHLIEPALWPDARQVQDLPRYKAVMQSEVSGLARAIARRVPVKPTHVIIAPHLMQGGADRRIVEYAKAVARAGGRPVVLLTDRDGDGTWEKAIPHDVQVIDCAAMMQKAGHSSSVLAIARVLMQWSSPTGAPVVHIINSAHGYAVLKYYGHALRDSGVKQIYCSLYGPEAHTDAYGYEKLGAASFNGWFFDAYKQIDMVLSDNPAHLRELNQVHGWPRTKTTTVPSVVQSLDATQMKALMAERLGFSVPAVRVLWASRIVKGKRLDRLTAIAKRALERKLPILFAVAGEPGDPQSRRWANEARKLPNVKLTMKAFDGWKDLTPGKIDVFLFTSQSEGMPNIVLEALAHGLKVVSTTAGGLSYLPYVHKIPDDAGVDAWLDEIVQPTTAEHLKSALAWVRDNHSQQTFDEQLQKAGYFDGLNSNGNGREEQGVDGEVEDARDGDAQV